MSDICHLSAVELARRIRAKELSAREVLSAHLDQIARLNPTLNAIVTLVADQAMARALAADEALARGAGVGRLHGLPIAHKDLQLTKGIRTTFGSPIYKDFVPAEDALLVERTRAAGAILVGKTNTPEFGAGSQTFNPIFGATLNPYDTTKTCGGSSGGAAVALACGMLPIADGTDMGGSLRNPASFCNIVGMRPSPGRVPGWPARMGWSTLSVDGPMGRSVADVALLLSAIAGPDRRSPIALGDPGYTFAARLGRDFKNVRVAWWQDLGFPLDSRVRAIVNVRFAGADGEAVLHELDRAGITVSTGSACSAASPGPSHVLIAMGLRAEEAHASVRFSLGEGIGAEDIERIIAAVPPVVAGLRRLGGDPTPATPRASIAERVAGHRA